MYSESEENNDQWIILLPTDERIISWESLDDNLKFIQNNSDLSNGKQLDKNVAVCHNCSYFLKAILYLFIAKNNLLETFKE